MEDGRFCYFFQTGCVVLSISACAFSSADSEAVSQHADYQLWPGWSLRSGVYFMEDGS